MNCPVCSSEIQDSFGLIECPKCQSVLFVDFDGSLKIQAEATSSVNTQSDPKVEIPSSEFEIAEIDIPASQAEPLAEILGFANSEESKLASGILVYDLKIENADTADIREEVFEILKDKKLNLDLKKLEFKMDKLEIKEMNPVKASVIVNRIKHLPVDISWTQRSLIQGEKTNE